MPTSVTDRMKCRHFSRITIVSVGISLEFGSVLPWQIDDCGIVPAVISQTARVIYSRNEVRAQGDAIIRYVSQCNKLSRAHGDMSI